MKLHLPTGLRSALFACFAAVASIGATLTTATVAGGVFAVALAGQQAQAADPEVYYYNFLSSTEGLGNPEASTETLVLAGVGGTSGTIDATIHKSGGKFWHTTSSTAWANTAALTEMNTTMGTDIRATDTVTIDEQSFNILQHTYASASQGNHSTLTLDFEGYAAGSQVILFLTVGTSKQAIPDAFSGAPTISGLTATTVYYATDTGNGFGAANEADYSGGYGGVANYREGSGVTMLKVTGTLDSSGQVAVSYDQIQMEKNGFGIVLAKVTPAELVSLVWSASESATNKWTTDSFNGQAYTNGAATAFTFDALAADATVTLSGAVVANEVVVEAGTGRTYTLVAEGDASLTASSLKLGNGTLAIGMDMAKVAVGKVKVEVGKKATLDIETATTLSTDLFEVGTGATLTLSGADLTFSKIQYVQAGDLILDANTSYAASGHSMQTNDEGVIEVAVGKKLSITGGDAFDWGSKLALRINGTLEMDKRNTVSDKHVISIGDGGSVVGGSFHNNVGSSNFTINASGATSMSSAVYVTDNARGALFNVAEGGRYVMSGEIKGHDGQGNSNAATGLLTKAGEGTMVFSGELWASSAFNVNAGTLEIGANDAFANNARYKVASGASLDISSYGGTAWTAELAGGTLTSTSVASVTMNGTVTLAADTASTIDAGTTTLVVNGAVSGAGSLTTAGAVQLTQGLAMAAGQTLTNNGSLTLGGTVVLGNAISQGAGSTLAFAENTIIDLSNLTANGNSYTLITSADGSGLDLSSLNSRKDLSIIGTSALGTPTWTFNNDGTLSISEGEIPTWEGGAMTWGTDGWTPVADTPWTTGADARFTGTADVTLDGNVTAGTVQIQEGAVVTLAAEGGNKLTANTIDLAGELILKSDVLEGASTVTAGGDKASLVIDGIKVDYTGELQNYTGAVTVSGEGGELSLSQPRGFSKLTVQDGATLALTNDYESHLVLNNGTVESGPGSLGSYEEPGGGSIVLESTDADGSGTVEAGEYSNNRIACSNASVYSVVSGTGNLVLERTGDSVFNICAEIVNKGDVTLAGADLNIQTSNNRTGQIKNAGNVIVDGTIDVTGGATIANTGSLTIKSGSLTVNACDVANTGDLLVDGGTMWIMGGSEVMGAGSITIRNNTTVEVGRLRKTGDLVIESGALSVWNNSAVSADKLAISSGSMSVGTTGQSNSYLNINSLEISGGRLDVKRAITLKGNSTVSLTGGTICTHSVNQTLAQDVILGAITFGGYVNTEDEAFDGGFTLGAADKAITITGMATNNVSLTLIGNISIDEAALAAFDKTEGQYSNAVYSNGFATTTYTFIQGGDNASLSFNGADTTTIKVGGESYTATAVNGSASYSVAGDSTYYINNENSVYGDNDTTDGIDAATKIVVKAGKLTFAGETTLANTIDVESGATLAVDANVSLSSVNLKGGTISLGAAELGGAIVLESNSAIEVTTTSTLTAGVTGSADLALTTDDSSTLTVAGAIATTGAVTLSGGAVSLDGAGSLSSRSLAITGGTLTLGKAISGGADYALTVADGGTLNIGSLDAWTDKSSNTGNSLRQTTYTIVSGLSGSVTATGKATSGSGTYDLLAGTDSIYFRVLTDPNDSSYHVTTGDVAYSTAATEPGATGITLDGGTLTIAATDTSIDKAITLKADSTVSVGDGASFASSEVTHDTGVLTLTGAGTYVVDDASAAIIKGDLSVTYTYAGDLTVDTLDNNRYTGDTAIAGTNVTIKTERALGSGSVTITSGSLEIDGTNQDANQLGVVNGIVAGNVTIKGDLDNEYVGIVSLAPDAITGMTPSSASVVDAEVEIGGTGASLGGKLSLSGSQVLVKDGATLNVLADSAVDIDKLVLAGSGTYNVASGATASVSVLEGATTGSSISLGSVLTAGKASNITRIEVTDAAVLQGSAVTVTGVDGFLLADSLTFALDVAYLPVELDADVTYTLLKAANINSTDFSADKLALTLMDKGVALAPSGDDQLTVQVGAVDYTLAVTDGAISLVGKFIGEVWGSTVDATTGSALTTTTFGEDTATTDAVFNDKGLDADGKATVLVGEADAPVVTLNSATILEGDYSFSAAEGVDDAGLAITGDLTLGDDAGLTLNVDTTVGGALKADGKDITNTANLTMGAGSTVGNIAGTADKAGNVGVTGDSVTIGDISNTTLLLVQGGGTGDSAVGVSVGNVTLTGAEDSGIGVDGSKLTIASVKDAASLLVSNGGVLTVTGGTEMAAGGILGVTGAGSALVLGTVSGASDVGASGGASISAGDVSMGSEGTITASGAGSVVTLGTVTDAWRLGAGEGASVTVDSLVSSDPDATPAYQVELGADGVAGGQLVVTNGDMKVSHFSAAADSLLRVGGNLDMALGGAAVTQGGSVVATTMSLGAVTVGDAVGHSFTGIRTDVLTLDVSQLAGATGSQALVTVGADGIASLATPFSLGTGSAQLTLTGIAGIDSPTAAGASPDYVNSFLNADGTVMGNGVFNIAVATGGGTLDIHIEDTEVLNLRQLFAVFGYDAVLAFNADNSALTLTVTPADGRSWDSDTPNWAGNPGSATDPDDISAVGIDLRPGRNPLGVAAYDRFDTVAHVNLKGSSAADGIDMSLVGETMADTKAGVGLILRDLNGTGTLRLTGDGLYDAADLAAGDLVTIHNTVASRQIDGGISATDITVQVQGEDGASLAMESLELTGAELAVLGTGELSAAEVSLTDSSVMVAKGGELALGDVSLSGASSLVAEAGSTVSADALNGTEGLVSGKVGITGKGGNYSGDYAGASIALSQGAEQTLAPKAGLTVVGNGGTAILDLARGSRMDGIATTGANVTLANRTAAPLVLGSTSSMVGGTLSFGVKGADVVAGLNGGSTPAITKGAALNLTGTAVVVTQQDAVNGVTFDLSQGTEGRTLIRLADSGTAKDVALTLGGEFFERYFENERLENGAVVADIVTDYYGRRLGQTENGRAGLAMLDYAVLSHNPQATAPEGDVAKVLNALDAHIAGGDAAAADTLAAAVAGAGVAGAGSAVLGDVDRQLKAIRNRMTSMGVDQCVVNEDMPYVNAWINAEGDYRKMDAEGTLAGYTLSSWGGTVGMDVDVSPELTFGLAATAMYGDYDSSSADVVSGDIDSYYLSAFARVVQQAWVHSFVATIGKQDISLKRMVNYGTGAYATEGDTDGLSFGLMYELGRTIALDEDATTCWQPVFNVQYRHVGIDGYTETGSDAALRFGDQTLNMVTFGLGARLQTAFGENVYNRTSLFEMRALAKLDAGDRASEADVAFAAMGSHTSKVKGAEMGAFGVELGAGLTVPLGQEGGSLFFDASLELRADYSNVNGTVGYRINF